MGANAITPIVRSTATLALQSNLLDVVRRGKSAKVETGQISPITIQK